LNLLNTHLPFKIGQLGDIKISIDGASLNKYRKERTEEDKGTLHGRDVMIEKRGLL
jgi:hypothetical protein